jgi:hypothetical protein
MVVNVLGAVLNRSCSEHRLSPGIVGTSSDLRDLVRWYLAGQPDAEAPDLARGWRREVCGDSLLDVLAGRRSIRVTAPGSDDPLTIDPVADDQPVAPASEGP